MEGTLEPCHLHLMLITLVAVNITKSKNIIIVGHVDKTR